MIYPALDLACECMRASRKMILTSIDGFAGRLDSFFTVKPGAPSMKRKEPETKGKGKAKSAKTAKKGGVGSGKKK